MRVELTTSAWLSLDQQGEGTVYKYGALTDCATGAPASFVLKLKLYGDCAAIATYDIHLDSLAVRWPSG